MNLRIMIPILSTLALLPIRGTRSAAPMTLPVRFVVLSGKAEVTSRATIRQMHDEIRIMNRHFVTQDGRSILRFYLHSLTPYDAIKDSPCEVVGLSNRPVQTKDFIFQVVACPDPRVFFPGALNVFIIDTYDRAKGYREEDSYGGGQGNRRFVALDYERLGHVFAAEEHELGHAFSLGHRCHPGATGRTKTNIMTQRTACPGGVGREGDRSIGFDEDQERQILKKAESVIRTIKNYVPVRGLRNGGFEDTDNFEWSRRAYTKNHRSGKYALWVDAGREISQRVFLEQAADCTLQFYFNNHGPGAFAAVTVNGLEVKRVPLPDSGGYGKPFAASGVRFRIEKPSIVEVRFYGGHKKLWIDDVSLK